VTSPNYRRAFWTSRHHAWLGILTLGLGFLSAEPLGLLIGAVAYALGLVFLPDAAFFRRSVDARETATRTASEAAARTAFQQQQEQTLAQLSPARRARHQQLLAVCREIEVASGEAVAAADGGTRRQKLDELAWTFLRMLAIEQTLDVYLETERKEQVPAHVRSLEAETHALGLELEALRKTQPASPALGTKERALTSRLERLEVLNQRLRRIEQAQSNHDLLRSEQERLVEQVKLIRADAIAAKNADTLTARIDLGIEHLAATNKWLSELAEFKDLTAQMPTPLPIPGAASSTPGMQRRPQAESGS
jgi:outer membrane murein-binding lipoprotein Lpp